MKTISITINNIPKEAWEIQRQSIKKEIFLDIPDTFVLDWESMGIPEQMFIIAAISKVSAVWAFRMLRKQKGGN